MAMLGGGGWMTWTAGRAAQSAAKIEASYATHSPRKTCMYYLPVGTAARAR